MTEALTPRWQQADEAVQSLVGALAAVAARTGDHNVRKRPRGRAVSKRRPKSTRRHIAEVVRANRLAPGLRVDRDMVAALFVGHRDLVTNPVLVVAVAQACRIIVGRKLSAKEAARMRAASLRVAKLIARAEAATPPVEAAAAVPHPDAVPSQRTGPETVPALKSMPETAPVPETAPEALEPVLVEVAPESFTEVGPTPLAPQPDPADDPSDPGPVTASPDPVPGNLAPGEPAAVGSVRHAPAARRAPKPAYRIKPLRKNASRKARRRRQRRVRRYWLAAIAVVLAAAAAVLVAVLG